MNKKIDKYDILKAIHEAAEICAKRIVNSAWEEAEAETKFYEAPNDEAAKRQMNAAKAWNAQKKRNLNCMKRLAELSGDIGGRVSGSELSLAEVIIEAMA